MDDMHTASLDQGPTAPYASGAKTEATQQETSVLIVKPARVWTAEAALRPVPQMLFDGLWYEGETTFLFASTNVGKSILAVQIAEAVASGNAVSGFRMEATPGLVLYADFELSDKQFEKRYSADGWCNHYEFSPNFYRAEINPDAIGAGEWDAAVLAEIESAIIDRGFRRVIVDNLTFVGSQTEKGRDAIPLMHELLRLKRKYGLSLLVLAHTPKRDASRPITVNDLAGSAHLGNFADGVFALGRSAYDPAVRYVIQLKARSGEIEYHADNVVVGRLEKPGNFLRFAFEGHGSESEHLRERSTREMEALDESILELNTAEPGLSLRQMAKRLGTNHTRVRRVLEQSGTVEQPVSPVPPVPPCSTGDGMPSAATLGGIVPGDRLALASDV